jgi:hypothetical protein
VTTPPPHDLASVTAERDRYLAALQALDAMDPDDYYGGVARTVNGALHGTDEFGRPLPPETAS